jgi:hypothetical protein
MRRALVVCCLALSAPALASTPREEALDLLARWLAAQNQGDRATYEALYDQDFAGVRRSGPKVAAYDRAGWLADRGRMFRKPMKVEAQGTRVFANRRTARLVFTQQWSSGGYRDLGPKQLILRRGKDGFRIWREELFASEKRAPAAAQVDAFARLAFVVDGEVVVSAQPDDAWAGGPPVLERNRRDLIVRVSRPVDPAKLPAALARLRGTRLRLMDAHGPRCEAAVGDFRLVGRAMVEDLGDADEAWASTRHLLVAALTGGCAGATWARAMALPVPTVAPAEPADKELRKRALDAFRALPASQAIQRRFAVSRIAHWTSVGATPDVRVMRPPGRPALVSAFIEVAEGDCADGFFARLWALWELRGDQLVLVNDPDPTMSLRPTAAADIDGDGHPALLFERFSDDGARNAAGQPTTFDHGVVRALGGRYVGVDGLELPIYICPC